MIFVKKKFESSEKLPYALLTTHLPTADRAVIRDSCIFSEISFAAKSLLDGETI